MNWIKASPYKNCRILELNDIRVSRECLDNMIIFLTLLFAKTLLFFRDISACLACSGSISIFSIHYTADKAGVQQRKILAAHFGEKRNNKCEGKNSHVRSKVQLSVIMLVTLSKWRRECKSRHLGYWYTFASLRPRIN